MGSNHGDVFLLKDSIMTRRQQTVITENIRKQKEVFMEKGQSMCYFVKGDEWNTFTGYLLKRDNKAS